MAFQPRDELSVTSGTGFSPLFTPLETVVSSLSPRFNPRDVEAACRANRGGKGERRKAKGERRKAKDAEGEDATGQNRKSHGNMAREAVNRTPPVHFKVFMLGL